MRHGWMARCAPLDREGLLDVLTRARARDREDHLAATGTPFDPHAAAAEIWRTARWAALITDGARAEACVYAVPGAQAGEFLVCINATDGWPRVWRTAVRWLVEVLTPSMLAAPEFRRALAVVVGGEARGVAFAEAHGFRRCAVQVPGSLILERTR